MSLVCIKNISLIEKQLLKNGSLAAIAFCLRRNNSKSSEAPYKFVKGRLRVEGKKFFFYIFFICL